MNYCLNLQKTRIGINCKFDNKKRKKNIISERGPNEKQICFLFGFFFDFFAFEGFVKQKHT